MLKNNFALIQLVENLAKSLGLRVFLVGGVVRDLLLGKQAQDLDFLVEGNAIDFASSLLASTGGELKKFEAFVTAKIVNPSFFPNLKEIDFASSRQEIYLTAGALPHVKLDKIEYDLQRRDFSINAMALPLSAVLKLSEFESDKIQTKKFITANLLDPFNGLSDLESGVIRVLHEKSFIDDPTRIFRAARYAARLGADQSTNIEAHTLGLIRQAIDHKLLTKISHYRVLQEFKKILAEVNPLAAFEILIVLGVFSQVGLCLAANENNLLKFYRNLFKADLKLSPELSFELAFVLCLEFCDPLQRDKIVMDFALGKKLAKHFRASLDLCFKPTHIEEIGDLALLLRYLWSLEDLKLNQVEIKQEMKKRLLSA